MPTQVKADMDTELAEENRICGGQSSPCIPCHGVLKYLHEREQSRREAVRIERARLDIERERFEDDEHRNLVV